MSSRSTSTDDGLTVSRTAVRVGVSVRTLHHWDDIGLVRPSVRTSAGYRVYSADDIARLQQVLVYRELGFSLADVGQLLNDPGADLVERLRRQRAHLIERVGRLRTMIGAVDRMIESSRSGIQLTAEQQINLFGDDWRPELLDEAERRWGDTVQWRQYAERAADRPVAEWERLVASTQDLFADAAAATRAGVEPGSPQANALAERHRKLMSNHFDCPPPLHACIGQSMIDDPRYVDYYDAIEPGLTGWLSAAILANAHARGTSAHATATS